MPQKVWVVCAEIHEFYPGNESIKINKNTTIEIRKKYKEYVNRRVLGVYTLSEEDNPHINNAVQQFKKQFEAEGYLVSINDIEHMKPDIPKKYVTFSGGSYNLIDSADSIASEYGKDTKE